MPADPLRPSLHLPEHFLNAYTAASPLSGDRAREWVGYQRNYFKASIIQELTIYYVSTLPVVLYIRQGAILSKFHSISLENGSESVDTAEMAAGWMMFIAAVRYSNPKGYLWAELYMVGDSAPLISVSSFFITITPVLYELFTDDHSTFPISQDVVPARRSGPIEPYYVNQSFV